MNSFEAEATQQDIEKLREVIQYEDCHQHLDSIISEVPDSQEIISIKTALALNKKTEDMLSDLLNQMIELHKQCQNKIQDVSARICKNVNEPNKQKNYMSTKYYICGRPFFKDKNLYPSPLNSDAIAIVRSGYIDYTDLPAQNQWSNANKKALQQAILCYVRRKKEKELLLALNRLERNGSKIEPTPENKTLRNQLEKEKCVYLYKLETLKNLSLKSLVLPLKDNEVMDWDEISSYESVNHSATECKAMWRTFLHPALNKQPWEHPEALLLRQLARRHRHSDWESIAEHLGTNRSAYQCFVYHEIHLSRGLTMGLPWTVEEDEFLHQVINYCQLGDYIPWSKVAFYFDNRTKEQIYSRWRTGRGERIGRFSPEEDIVLLAGVKEYGTRFGKITPFVPGRSKVQLKERYTRLMVIKNDKLFWTSDDDTLLLKLLDSNESEEVDFKQLMNHFTGKSVNSIRKRSKFLRRWTERNPGKHISLIRRTKTELEYLNVDTDLETAVSKLQMSLKNKVPKRRCPPTGEDRYGTRGDSHFLHSNVDYELMSYFKADLMPKKVDNAEITDNVPELKTFLHLLGAKLNKELMKNADFELLDDRIKTLADKVLNDQPTSLQPIKTTTLKTYSRKKPTVPNVGPVPSTSTQLVGSPQICNTQYTFPASFGTLYALSVFLYKNAMKGNLSHCSSFNCPQDGLSEQLARCLSRFGDLFTWPAILSNINPNPALFVNDVEMSHLKSEQTENVICPKRKIKSEIEDVATKKVVKKSADRNIIAMSNELHMKIAIKERRARNAALLNSKRLEAKKCMKRKTRNSQIES